MTLLMATLLSSCGTTSYQAASKKPGVRVPAVSAYNQFAQLRDVRERASGEWGVVFFYPEADTPG